MFEFLKEAMMRMRAEDWFGARSPAAAPGGSVPAPAAAQPLGATGPAIPGMYSPAADTLLDEREMYLARSAYFDDKWAGDPMIAQAMGRHRGEAVADPAIGPELGAPTSSRPLADPDEVLASAVAETAARNAPAAAAAPAPSGGLPEDEIYRDREAYQQSKWAGNPMIAKAMARHRGEAVAEPAIKPELGAPTRSRPLRDPDAVIAGVVAESRPAAPAAPATTPADPSERDNYLSRRAALDSKAATDDLYQQALARLAARKAAGGAGPGR